MIRRAVAAADTVIPVGGCGSDDDARRLHALRLHGRRAGFRDEPGTTNGQGVNDVWFVVDADGELVTSAEVTEGY
jgi:hypothetical protein